MATKRLCSFAGLLASCVLLAWAAPAPGETLELPAQAPSPAGPPPAPAPRPTADPPPTPTQALRVQPDIEVKQTTQPRAGRGEVGILVEVHNVGSIAVEDLSLRTTLPSGVALVSADPAPERIRSSVSWSLGALRPGACGTLRLAILTSAGAAIQTLPFSLSFQASHDLPVQVSVSRGEIAVDGPTTATVNVPLTLKINVKNSGTAPLRQAILRIILPPGLTHPAGNDLENQLDSLGPGQTLSIPITLTPKQEGNASVKLRLMPPGGEAVEADHLVLVRQDPLTLTAAGPTVAQRRDVCNWSLDVGCNDPVAGAVRLVVHLPEGIAYLQSGEGGTYDPATHSVVWNLPGLGPAKPHHLGLQVVARQIGAQEYRAVLTADRERVKETTWSTRVMLPPPPGRTGP